MKDKKIVIEPGITTGPQAVKHLDVLLKSTKTKLKEWSARTKISKMSVSQLRRDHIGLSPGMAYRFASGLRWLGANVHVKE